MSRLQTEICFGQAANIKTGRTFRNAMVGGLEGQLRVKPGLPPWGPHVRFRREQTLVREGQSLAKLRNSA
jgi:hypothetical protein